MKPITESHAVDHSPYRQFRLRVLGSDAAHPFTAGRDRKCVHVEIVPLEFFRLASARNAYGLPACGGVHLRLGYPGWEDVIRHQAG